MNTTASYSADSSWSRRGSTETVFSIQDKDTDIARDTSDTEWLGSDGELEPVSESDGDPPVVDDTSSQSDDDIIATKVIEVSALDEGDLELADSERTASESDSETDLFDFWQCAQCRAPNDKPLYRYCQKCYKVRKNFFPPRPKRKKRSSTIERKQRVSKDTDSSSSDENDEVTVKPDAQERSGAITVSVAESVVSIMRSLSQDSGVGSSQDARSSCSEGFSQHTDTESVSPSRVRDRSLKRRAESTDREEKRARTDYADTDSEVDKPKKAMSEDLNICDPKPLVKTVSDPSLNVESTHNLTKKALINALKEKLEPKEDNCIICYSEPKSGVFVHGRVAHICCCYKCAVKVWAKAKRCPVCNCKVSNVLKAVVM